jgi:hypothetical protein
MTAWLVCPECGCGKGEDHKRGCLRRHAPPIMDYSKLPRAPGKMRGPTPRPLLPVTEAEPYKHRATSVVKP